MRAADPDANSMLNFFLVEPISAITPDGVPVDRNNYDITVSMLLHVSSFLETHNSSRLGLLNIFKTGCGILMVVPYISIKDLKNLYV